MNTLLVVNPAAGHGKGKKCFERLEPVLKEKAPGIEIRVSEYAGHAVEIGKKAARQGFDRLICLGGDGTPYEVIAGLYDEGRPARLRAIGLVLFNEVNRREILSIFGAVFSGKHAAHPKVEMRQAARITVEADPPLRLMADGELLGWTPLKLKVLPGELTILA
jgi:diacylglycerol kinase family enzyme